MSAFLGQALVTDPGGAAGGGYALVAVSPAVASADADFLAATSQVTDYLHLEEAPRSYLSLYDLPSGERALTRRFAHGKRRGDYNRIVVHTLVIPEEALTAVAWNPWQLLGKGRLSSAADGSAVSFPALGVSLAESLPAALDDLSLAPAAGARRELAEALAARRRYLAHAWGTERLRRRLAWTLETLVAGHRPMLEQTPEDEQLLALAWLLLPVVDRRRVRWSTHLAVTAEDLFHLANTPAPDQLVDERSGGWRAAPATLPVEPGDRGVAALLTALFGEDGSRPLGSLTDLLAETRDSLLGGSDRLALQIAALGVLDHLPAEGHPTVAAFQAALREVRVTARQHVEDTGLPARAVLRCAAATARRVVLERDDAAWPTVRELRRVVEERLRLPGLLAPQAAVELAAEEAGSRALPWAVALVVDALPPVPGGAGHREVLAEALLAPRPVPLDDAADAAAERETELRDRLLARLAAELVGCRSQQAFAALEAVAQVPGGIRSVRARLEQAADLEGLLTVVSFARRSAGPQAAAAILREDLVPMLAAHETVPQPIRRAQLAAALDHFRHAPEALGEAVRGWRGELQDIALGRLAGWPREAAAAAIAELLRPPVVAVPSRPAVVGIARSLQEKGLGAREWLPFAVAEAGFHDRQGSPEGRRAFTSFVAGQELDDAALARQLLRSLESSAAAVRGCQRALVQAALPGLVQLPLEAGRHLGALLDAAPPAEVAAWASVVERAAASSDPETAEALRWRWWCLFAQQLDGAKVPAEAVSVLCGLNPEDRTQAVAGVLPQLPFLRQGREEEELLLALVEEAAGGPQAGAVALALVERDRELGRLRLDQAAARTYELTWRRPPEARAALERLLPSVPVERAAALLELVSSPHLWPGGKLALMSTDNGSRAPAAALERALELAGEPILERLPPVGELAAEASAFLAVARFVGHGWSGWRRGGARNARRLVSEALDAGRGDFVGAFLGAAEATRPRDGFLHHLVEERDLSLLRQLCGAIDRPWGASMVRYAPRLRASLDRACSRAEKAGRP